MKETETVQASSRKDYEIITYDHGKQIVNEEDPTKLLEEAENAVRSIYDRYDVLFIDENLKSAQEDGQVIYVNYEKPKAILVEGLKQTLLCRSIIIPYYERFPAQSIIIISDQMNLSAYAAKSSMLRKKID